VHTLKGLVTLVIDEKAQSIEKTETEAILMDYNDLDDNDDVNDVNDAKVIDHTLSS